MGAAAIPAALSLAASGLGAMGSISQGQTNAANARAQGQDAWMSAFYNSEQAKLDAQIGELRAVQTDTVMRRSMEGVLANVDAVSALSGATDNSPSTWAVRNRYENLADEARTTATANLRMEAAAKRNAAQLYQMSGMRAMQMADQNASAYETQGMLGAAGALFKGLGGINWG